METWIWIGGFFLVFAGAIAVDLIQKKRSDQRAARNGGVDPVQAEKDREIQKAREEYLRSREKSKMAGKIVKTEILSQSAGQTVTKGSMTSSLGRAAVGGMIGGTVGAIAGAATGKQVSRHYGKTTFRLYYADGHTKIETVSDGTPVWQKYMELLPKS